jgi:hypothetical protein
LVAGHASYKCFCVQAVLTGGNRSNYDLVTDSGITSKNNYHAFRSVNFSKDESQKSL